MFEFGGVSELTLEVADLEAAEEFYGRLLNSPVVDRRPKAVWLLLVRPGLALDLLRAVLDAVTAGLCATPSRLPSRWALVDPR
jgi:catechol-2,3-dioxygenase